MTFFLIRKTQPTPLLFVKNNLLKILRTLCQWRGYPISPSDISDKTLTFNFPISFSTKVFGVYKNVGSSSSTGISDRGCSVFDIDMNSFKTHTYHDYTYSSIFSIGY